MIDEYSVRLSRADDPKQLLGSGTLIIRRRNHQVFLLTCAHVVRSLDDGEYFQVEYYSNQSTQRTKTLPPKKGFIRCGNGAFDIPEKDLSIGEDYVCYPLPWEPWMGGLSDTQWERPKSFQRLSGFGFPTEKNNVYSECAPMAEGLR